MFILRSNRFEQLTADNHSFKIEMKKLSIKNIVMSLWVIHIKNNYYYHRNNTSHKPRP